MRTFTKIFISTGLTLATFQSASLMAVASGDHDDGHHNLAGRPGDPDKASKTVRLVASEIKFDAKRLTFKVGETIKFVVTNHGEQDHELTIGDHHYQLDHRKEMQEMAGMEVSHTGGMTGHGHIHADGSTVTVKPGETRDLVWQFTRRGKFEFDCNIPGHAEAGMAGMIVVR